MMICNDNPIETMKPIMRPDSKRALIFSAIKADSGDCGLNLNMFQILLWNDICDHIWGEKVYLRRGLLVSDSRFWRPTLALLLFLALLLVLDSVFLALAFSRVSLVLPPLISSAETQAKGAFTIFIWHWWVTSMGIYRSIGVCSGGINQQYYDQIESPSLPASPPSPSVSWSSTSSASI